MQKSCQGVFSIGIGIAIGIGIEDEDEDERPPRFLPWFQDANSEKGEATCNATSR